KTISKEAAVDMAKTNKLPAFYYKRVGRSSFVKQIGDHRIVMLDTGSDAGILDSTSDGIRSYFGIGTSESERNFADGNPDSVGVEDSWLQRMKKILDDNPSGVVLVGMHAPPINPSGNEYPHFFRETEHPAIESVGVVYPGSMGIRSWQAGDDIGAYFLRHYGDSLDSPLKTKGKPYFSKGMVGELLDYGIAKNKHDEWLQLFAGVGTARKVDIVLFGHVHYRAEFRVVWDASAQKFEFYFDFYTENPGVYYNSRKLDHPDPVSIEVRQDAPAKGTMIEVDTPWGKTKRLQVPPYAKPLNSATDKRAWWNTHRPLLLQTAPVGPMEANQRHETIQGKKRTYPGPSFSGCRLIAVKDNVIDTIRYVTL